MIDAVLRMLFRCFHRHITRPITPLDERRVSREGTYVVCLDCGSQLTYDWERMRVGGPTQELRNPDALRHALAKEANGQG